MITLPKYGSREIPVFVLAKGDTLLVGESSLELTAYDEVLHSDGRKYPGKIAFKWESGAESVEATLTKKRIIEARSLLELIPFVVRKIARLFVNPYYFRFEGELELKIDLKEVKDSVKGKTLYEIMYLRGKK